MLINISSIYIVVQCAPQLDCSQLQNSFIKNSRHCQASAEVEGEMDRGVDQKIFWRLMLDVKYFYVDICGNSNIIPRGYGFHPKHVKFNHGEKWGIKFANRYLHITYMAYDLIRLKYHLLSPLIFVSFPELENRETKLSGSKQNWEIGGLRHFSSIQVVKIKTSRKLTCFS